MSKAWKIAPYIVIILMGVFIYMQLSKNNDIALEKEKWEAKEKEYLKKDDSLRFENNDLLFTINVIKKDRLNLTNKLDSIRNIINNEKPIPTYSPVSDDKLLDSILHYVRK